jgi:hypothetical protein
MRTVLLALLASLVASTLTLAPPATGAGNGYKLYIACGTSPDAKPANECRLSQTKAAFFRSSRHDATYRVCVRFPDRGRRLCAGAQEAEQGRLRHVTISTTVLGRHVVTWYVAGEQIGRRAFRVTDGRRDPPVTSAG